MGSYVQSIWRCRRFWFSLVLNDLQLRYRRSVLGVGWSLLLPLCTSLVLGAVFHEVFKVPIHEFLPFLFSGLSVWAFITGVTVEGCQSYIQAESYIRQHPLPLAIYPLRTALGAMLHLLIAIAVVFVMARLLTGPADWTALLYLIPALGVLFIFGWGVAVLFGFINTVFRDTQHILQVVFQILFYLTPIIYPASMLSDSRIGWIVHYNPLVSFLELIRRPLLLGQAPSPMHFAVAGVCCLMVGVLAVATLEYQQRRIVFHL